MVPATHLLRPCSLQRTAPFQRNSQSSSSAGQAGPGPCSTSAPAVVPSAAPCAMQAKAPHLQTSSLDRRDMLLLSSSLVMSHLAQISGPSPSHAAGQGINRYIRRKTLDPLETYVPLVLEARSLLPQARDLAAKDVAAARELLREGPYGGLRDNIRALGEYAARDGRSPEVGPLVTGFFRALEDYDTLLLTALRTKTAPSSEDVAARVADLDSAFGRLLATVPPEVLEQASRVLQVANAKAAEAEAAAVAAAAASAAAGPAADREEARRAAEDLVMLLR